MKAPTKVHFQRHETVPDTLLYTINIPKENPPGCHYTINKREKDYFAYKDVPGAPAEDQPGQCSGEIKNLKINKENILYVHALSKEQICVSSTFKYDLGRFT